MQSDLCFVYINLPIQVGYKIKRCYATTVAWKEKLKKYLHISLSQCAPCFSLNAVYLVQISDHLLSIYLFSWISNH